MSEIIYIYVRQMFLQCDETYDTISVEAIEFPLLSGIQICVSVQFWHQGLVVLCWNVLTNKDADIHSSGQTNYGQGGISRRVW